MTDELIEKPLAEVSDIASLLSGVTPNKYATSTAMSTVSKASDFLPYVALHGSNSKLVKKGEFPMGHFGLSVSSQSVIDLGDNFVMLVLAWRPKAMAFNPKAISYFDPNSEDFKRIEDKSKNTKEKGWGCGPEFLIWLPDKAMFASYYLGNKTGRNESPNILGPLQERGPFVCKQESHLIETTEFSWHGPRTRKHDLGIILPPAEKVLVEVNKFNNPPVAQEELADDGEGEERR